MIVPGKNTCINNSIYTLALYSLCSNRHVLICRYVLTFHRLIETHLCVLFRPDDDESTAPTRPSTQNIHDAANIIAEKTGGYVAADINALVSEARKILAEVTKTQFQALSEQSTQGTSHQDHSHLTSLLVQSFDRAMHAVGPSCLRGIAIKLPKVF